MRGLLKHSGQVHPVIESFEVIPMLILKGIFISILVFLIFAVGLFALTKLAENLEGSPSPH
jgi:hypothetical protein